MFEEKKTLKKMDPFPISSQDWEENHNAEAEEKSQSPSKSQKSHKTRPNRNHQRLATPALPSINIDMGKGVLSMKGQPCDFRYTESKNNRGTSPQIGEQGCFHIKEIDKQHLMRNFPLAYFENIDLLFKIVKKKKKFVKNTYKTHTISKNQQQNMKEQDEFQRKPNDLTKQFVRSKENKLEKGFGKQKSLNRQIQSQGKNHNKIHRKYHQVSTLSNNKSLKDEKKQFRKTLSDRKFVQINNKNTYIDEKSIEDQNKNSLHTVLKEKSKVKQVDNYIKQSIQDDFLRNLTKKNSLKQEKSPKNIPILSKRNKLITHKKQITQVQNLKNNYRQNSDDKNINTKYQLINLPQNRKSQQMTSNIYSNDPKINQQRSKSINKANRTSKNDLFTKRNVEKSQITNKDTNSPSSITIHKGVKKQPKIDRNTSQAAVAQDINKMKTNKNKISAQKQNLNGQKKQLQNKPSKENSNNIKYGINNKDQPPKHVKRNFSSTKIQNPIRQVDPSIHTNIINKSPKANQNLGKQQFFKKQPLCLISKVKSSERDHFLGQQRENLQTGLQKTQDLSHIPITQCIQDINSHSPNSFYQSQQLKQSSEPQSIKANKQQNRNLNQISSKQPSQSLHSSQQSLSKNNSLVDIRIEDWHMNNIGLKLTPLEKDSQNNELSIKNLAVLQQKGLNSYRSSQKENSLKITPVFQSKQNSSIKKIDNIVNESNIKQQKISNENNNIFFDDEECQRIEQQFSHLKVNLHKQSSKLSPNCSNIDPQQINNFYDEILQLDVERPTFYCPKMGRLSNLQNNNHSFRPKTNSSLHQQPNHHQDNEKQFVNNISQNNLDKQIILYTSSKDIINSCDQTIAMPALAKKKSSKVSIFSSSSQPRKIFLNKFNQNSQLKKDLLHMPNEEERHNLSDFSVKQSQNHEQSSDQQPLQKTHLSQSMICIDINKKQSSPQSNKQKLFTNKISIEMVTDPQQQDRIYSISINQIQNIPRYEAFRQERTSAQERMGQSSQKDIIKDGSQILDEEKCISDISLLKMNSQQQDHIDNDLQLVIIPVQEDLNLIYKFVEECIEDGKKIEEIEDVPQNRKIAENFSEFTSSESEIPIKISKRQSRMTQIQRKQQSLKEKSMKNSRSMKQLKRIEILSSENSQNIGHSNLQSKEEDTLKNQNQIAKAEQNNQYHDQWQPLQAEEPKQPSPLLKQNKLQTNNQRRLEQMVTSSCDNVKQSFNGPSAPANYPITEYVTNQSRKKQQIDNALQVQQVSSLIEEKHQTKLIQQSTSFKEKLQKHIAQPNKQRKQMNKQQKIIDNAQKKNPLAFESQENKLELQDTKRLDEFLQSHNFRVIKTSQSSFRNKNQLHKMYQINIFNQLTPTKIVGHQEISINSNNLKQKQVQQIMPKEQKIKTVNNTSNTLRQKVRQNNVQKLLQQPLSDKIIQNKQLQQKQSEKVQHSTQQKDTKRQTKQYNKRNIIQLIEMNPSNQPEQILKTENKQEEKPQSEVKSDKLLVNKLQSSQKQIIKEETQIQNVQTKKQQLQNERQLSPIAQFSEKNEEEKQQISQNDQNGHIPSIDNNLCVFRKDNRQITFQKMKQLSCLVEEQFIYPDQCPKTQSLINEQLLQQPVSQQRNIQQTHEPAQQRQIQRANTQRSTLKGSQQDMLTVRSTNMKDISTNTFDLIRKYSENSEKQIQSDDIAKISRLLSVFDRKRINKLEEKNTFPAFQELWNIIMKIFIYLDSNNCYIDRIVDKKSVWLYNPFEKKSQFYRYSILESQQMTRQQRVQECLLRILSTKQNIINDSQAIKIILQSLTGMPVLILKETCYNKLDNLYRHGNIFGFTFGKGEVWRIVGTLQSKKASSQKKVRLQMLSNKEIKEISWKRFLQQFKYSFIAGFSQSFHLRSLKIDSKFTKSNPSIKISIKQQPQDKKNHCIMGVSIRSTQSSQISGKMLVYGKTQSQKPGEQCFKYLGSGDIGLISMKLKKGQYIIVLQLDQNNHGKQMELLLGSESKNIQIRLQKK